MARSYTWTIKGGRVLGPAPFFIAGIVNVTPDSFYDGGRHFDPLSALDHGRKLVRQGAHILDVGGESTRPGAEPVPMSEELLRVLPVVAGLSELGCSGLDSDDCTLYPVLSIDTFKAKVADAALAAGAHIVNDISACRFDPKLAEVLAEHKPGYVLMHALDTPRRMQSAPKYLDVVDEIMSFLAERLEYLVGKGLPEDRIVIDPGIGFGKTPEHNIAIMRNVDRFGEFGLPVYMGLSNKSVWGALLDLGVEQRTYATVAATVATYARGAAIHRVHDVAAAHQALTVASNLF